MKLRSQVFLFLLLLGLTPLLVSVAINIPLVLDRLELFYHKAYLQKLRADFRDLDQHITRRQEMVRLFAKLPEPGMAPGKGGETADDTLAQRRQAYSDWANRVLFDQPDIIQVTFINKNGDVVYALERDRETGILGSGQHAADLPGADFIAAGLEVGPGAVLTSHISFNRDIIEEMSSHCQRPVIMPFSNPTDHSEARPEEVIRWTEGRALVATGSPFDDVDYEGRRYRIGQGNNVFIFPGLGLGALLAGASRVSDGMISATAVALAEEVTQEELDKGMVYPEIGRLRDVSRVVAAAVMRAASDEGVGDSLEDSEIESRIDAAFWDPRYRRYVAA